MQYAKLYRLVSVDVQKRMNLRCSLQKGRGPSDGHQRTPEDRHRILSVHMTSIPKAKGDTREDDGKGENQSDQAPTTSLGEDEKLLPRDYVPANLKMHRERPKEYPRGHSHPTKYDESSRPCAC